jgi:hypothetical protein
MNLCMNCISGAQYTLGFAVECRSIHLLADAAGLVVAGGYCGMRAITLISKSKPASQLTPSAVQFG